MIGFRVNFAQHSTHILGTLFVKHAFGVIFDGSTTKHQHFLSKQIRSQLGLSMAPDVILGVPKKLVIQYKKCRHDSSTKREKITNAQC